MSPYHVALLLAFVAGAATTVLVMTLLACWPRRPLVPKPTPLTPLEPPRRRGDLILIQSKPRERQ